MKWNKIIAATVAMGLLSSQLVMATPAYTVTDDGNFTVSISGEGDIYNSEIITVVVNDTATGEIIFIDDFTVSSDDGRYSFVDFSLKEIYGFKCYKADVIEGVGEPYTIYIPHAQAEPVAGGMDYSCIAEDIKEMPADILEESIEKLYAYMNASAQLALIDTEDYGSLAENVIKEVTVTSATEEELKEEIEGAAMLIVLKKNTADITKEYFEQHFDIAAKVDKVVLPNERFATAVYGSLTDSDKSTIYSTLSDEANGFGSYDALMQRFKTLAKQKINANEKEESSVGGTTGGKDKSTTTGTGTSAYKPVVAPVIPVTPFFNDVAEEHWAYNAVKALKDKGVINGYEDGSFKGDKSVTRAEFITMATKMLNKKSETLAEAGFEDVAAGAWYAEAVNNAFGLGLITGDGNAFRPDDIITREDAVVIMNRVLTKLFGETESEGEAAFDDKEEIADYAVKAVKSLTEKGLVKGRGSNEFAPKGNLTRAETAQLLHNLSLYIAGF